ncbi:MAG: hypothetical protein ACI81V_000944 [Lentimonas sp.]|jgi:hypothetical protein
MLSISAALAGEPFRILKSTDLVNWQLQEEVEIALDAYDASVDYIRFNQLGLQNSGSGMTLNWSVETSANAQSWQHASNGSRQLEVSGSACFYKIAYAQVAPLNPIQSSTPGAYLELYSASDPTPDQPELFGYMLFSGESDQFIDLKRNGDFGIGILSSRRPNGQTIEVLSADPIYVDASASTEINGYGVGGVDLELQFRFDSYNSGAVLQWNGSQYVESGTRFNYRKPENWAPESLTAEQVNVDYIVYSLPNGGVGDYISGALNVLSDSTIEITYPENYAITTETVTYSYEKLSNSSARLYVVGYDSAGNVWTGQYTYNYTSQNGGIVVGTETYSEGLEYVSWGFFGDSVPLMTIPQDYVYGSVAGGEAGGEAGVISPEGDGSVPEEAITERNVISPQA